jgi:esterase
VTQIHRTVVRNDVRLAVTDSGGGGAAVVLIHGLTRTQREWDAVAPQLTERFRVVTYDQRCHGSSSRGTDHSWSAFVGDLRALLDDLELHDVTLVGHSIGAGVALQVAVETESCRTLVLLDGAFPVPEPEPEPEPDGGRLHMPRSVWTLSKRTLKDPFRRIHSLSGSEVREVGNDYRSQYSAFDLALRSIECPTTLILGSQMEFGRHGPAFQAARQETAARVMQSNPRVHVQWIGARHDMIQTQPEAIAHAIIRLQALA